MPHLHRPVTAALAAGASALALAVITPAASAQTANYGSQPAASSSAPDRVIVQLNGTPALEQAPAQARHAGGPNVAALRAVESDRTELRADQRALVSRARAAGVEVRRQRHSFTDLIDAIALTVPADDVDDLERLPGVRAVYPDDAMHISDDASNELIGAPQVWERTDGHGRQVRGEGVTVAVVDTGIDYSHPDLGGGFGPGHKVVGGYDFVNDDTDPMDDNGHGTHVAGIVAADGSDTGGVTGVAPKATLTAYKVLNGSGNGFESDVIAGLEAAVAPDNPYRADVVNMSLSGPGDGTDPIGQAATAASQGGVVVVAAAGNAGPAAGTVGTPAAADEVLSVGASVSGLRLPTAHILIPPRRTPSFETPKRELLQSYRAGYSANPPEQPVTGELVDVGQGTPEDYDRVGDVTGKVVAYQKPFIPRSVSQTSPLEIEQARLAEDRGAIALIGYNPGATGPVFAQGAGDEPAAQQRPGADGLVDVPVRTAASGDSFRMDELVVLGVGPLQWQELERYQARGPVRISISGEDVTDRVAAFSSHGPTGRYTLAPDLVAPGVEIASTWPKAQWEPGVFRLSGTSMASPHVAGAAALLRQLRPDDTASDIRAELVGSAKGLSGYGPTVQGAGRLDVAAAADATVTASPATLSLGLADMSRRRIGATGTVRLHNHADHPVRLSLAAAKAPGSPGTVEVAPARARIDAGGTLAVTVRLGAHRPTVDTDLSGWVVAHVDGSPDVRVPYLLAARPLLVRSTPDPSDGRSEAFVHSPTALASPPVVTVVPPHGRVTTVTMTLDHGTWYRARVTGRHEGTYRLTARAWTEGGLRLVGRGFVEVLPPDNRHGGHRWQPVGPNGEAGAIATTPAEAGTLAVTQLGKVGPWVTRDSGATWRQVDRLPVAAGTGTVIIDARHPRRMWYAVTGTIGHGQLTAQLDPTYQGKVLRSDDAGHSWQVLDFPDARIFAFVSDADTRTLVAVLADTVLVSRNGGRSWSAYASPIAGIDLTGAAMGGGDLYLSTFSRVWALRGIVSGTPSASEQVYDAGDGQLHGMVADEELVAALTSAGEVVGSHDGGRHWRTLHQLPAFGPQSITMRRGTIMVAGLFEHYIGRKHGRSWTTVPTPVFGPVVIDFAPMPGRRLLLSAERGGLFTTDEDGADPRRIGVQGVTPHDLAVSVGADGQTMLLAGTDAEVYRTSLPTGPVTAETTEWGLSGFEGFQSGGARVGQVETAPSDPHVMWKVRKVGSVGQFFVFRSQDGGATWEERGDDREVPFDLAVSPFDPDRVVIPFASLDGNGLYLTRDGGETWRKAFHDEGFTTVAADPRDPDRLWLGGASGLYRSDDFGETVTRVASGLVTAIQVDGRRIVAAGDAIRVSTDGGRSFRTADTGGLPVRVSDIVASPTSHRTLYAATTSYAANGLPRGGRGVLRSTDNGRTWVNVSGGLQDLAVESLAVSPDGRWLFAGTVQGGVHRLRLRG